MDGPRELFSGEVGEHATPRVPTCAPSEDAGEVRRGMIGGSFDLVDEVVVLERGRPVGLVALSRLLESADEKPIRELMDADPVILRAGSPEESAAWAMVRHRQSNLLVVGPGGSFAGLVPSNMLIGRLLAEHDELSARIGGYLASRGRARLSAEEPIRRRLLHRLPWLLVGLLGAMASAVIVGAFETQLDEKILLAFFVPAIVYMADAVGTQTETLLIRGMSADIDVGRVARQEMATGVLIGLLVGAVFSLFVLVGWGDRDVALAVGLALAASCSIATTVATVLPRALSRLGTDPAFGSGPVATIIQDLLSIAVYLAIATPLTA